VCEKPRQHTDPTALRAHRHRSQMQDRHRPISPQAPIAAPSKALARVSNRATSTTHCNPHTKHALAGRVDLRDSRHQHRRGWTGPCRSAAGCSTWTPPPARSEASSPTQRDTCCRPLMSCGERHTPCFGDLGSCTSRARPHGDSRATTAYDD
jgi:hypothetical protein